MAISRARAEAAAPLIEAEAAVNGGATHDLFAGLPRRTPQELDDLARAQEAPLEADIESLRGDFWPASESVDEFLAWLRRSRDDE
jgi:hypothetical protein